MSCTLFEKNYKCCISIAEAKKILRKNSNTYSNEEVKKIVDFLHAFSELSVEHLENQKRKSI